jgi:hypothetical protein
MKLLVASAAVAAIVYSAMVRNAVGDTTLAEIIEKVKGNEALFDNCDATIRTNFQLHREPVTFLNPSNAREIVEYDQLVRCVRQNDRFRIDFDRTSRAGSKDAAQERLTRIRVCDGKMTRARQEGITNAKDGVHRDADYFQPHTMIVQPTCFSTTSVPLSVLLQGEKAIAAAIGEDSIRGNRFTVEYKGEEVIEHESCHKIYCRLVRKDDDSVSFSVTIWLSTSHNWMPVRSETVQPLWSSTKNIFEATVSKFREVAPGVWCPTAARAIAYDDVKLQQTGTQVLSWEENFSVENISLGPRFPLSTFREFDAVPVKTPRQVETK